MKKIFISLLAILLTPLFAYTQNNIFPASGNVGIGTHTPTSKLEIFQDKGESQGMRISHPETAVKIYMNVAKNGLGEYGYVNIGGFTTFRGNDANSSFQGNLGIGIANPAHKLDVNGDIKTNKQLILTEATNQNNQSPGIIGALNDNFLYKGKYFNHYGLGFYRDEKGYLKAYFSDYFGIDFFTNGSHRMVIGGNGNIGIGTTNPDEKLTVNGTLHAKEVKVDLQIPADYVFQKYYTGVSSLKPEYHLPALQEIEKFTRENHHLPGIPSANEIQENGLHVGEMSNLLLQKVEELTLYTLEQEKKITEQNSTLQTQQNELEKLKGELNEIKKLLTP